MNKLQKVGGALMALGGGGLALAFTSVLRERWGTEYYLVGALVSLAVGAVIYFIGHRKKSSGDEA